MKSTLLNNKLTQKNGKDFRTFELYEKGVITEYKHEGDYSKYEVEFENIEFKEIIVNKKPNKAEVGLFFSVLINLFFLLCILVDQLKDKEISSTIIGGAGMGIIGGTSAWAAKLFKKEYIKHIKGNTTISFLYRNKEKEVVDDFIDMIKKAKQQHFRNTYLKIDEHIPTEQQKQTFLWLYQTNQIDKKEYEDMLNELENIRIIKGE
jgi:hypothetical protein